MEKIFEEQTLIGESIEKAFANFKKSSASRRTSEYKKKKLEELNALWNKFTSNDDKIKNLAGREELKGYDSSKTEQMFATYKDSLMLIPETNSEVNLTDAEVKWIKSQQTRFDSLKRAVNDVLDIIANNTPLVPASAKIKTKNIEKIWERISISHEELSSSMSNIPDSYQTQFEELEEEVEKCLIHLQGQTSTVESAKHDGTLKLQRVTIPKFDGDYFKWTSFRDLFDSMVIKNKSLSLAQRMQVLKTNLEGEAEALISDLTIADINFECAWKRLVDRYENTRVIVHKYLNKFISQSGGKADAKAVKILLDTTDQMMLGLKNLGRPTQHWDDWIVFLTTKKLAEEHRKDWEKKIGDSTDPPTWKDLKTFLEQEFRMLENLESNNKKKEEKNTVKSLHSGVNQIKCPACMKSHKLFSCLKFRKMGVPERWQLAKKQKLCFTCLQKHTEKLNCERKQPCKKCDSSKHSTWLHNPKIQKLPETLNTDSTPDILSEKIACNTMIIEKELPVISSEQINTYAAEISTKIPEKQVLLATARIIIRNSDGKRTTLRALFDSGSQGSMITRQIANFLNLESAPSDKRISGLGGNHSGKVNVMTVYIQPWFESDYQLQVNCYILKSLTTALPETNLQPESWSHLKKLTLADPCFFKRGPIDILLGTDVLAEVMQKGLVKGESGEPMAQKTQFGWIVSGNINKGTTGRNMQCLISTNDEHNEILDLKKFWEIEEVHSTRTMTPEEETCEKIYQQNVHRNNEGKFIVKIPFKNGENGPEGLGSSRNQCMARYIQLENRFSKDKKLKEEYSRVIQEYITLGHLVPAEKRPEHEKLYFIPHHAVLKPDSLTTKLRVVFDASAKTSTGRSLNDCMYVGKKQQRDLIEILIQWRLYKIVFKADITKMYRQIHIDKDDQRYHTIFWRNDTSEKIKEYQLTRVTFGTAAAPFLATRTLNQIAIERENQFPIASSIIKNNFYVDDLIAGQNDVTGALLAKEEIIKVLNEGGFTLTKWTSNSQQFLNSLPVEMTERALQKFEDNESTTALGLQWNPTSDKFGFQTTWFTDDNGKLTKRRLLSEASKLFDPLGWLSPVIISVKLLIKETWLLNVNWDDEVPNPISKKWKQMKNEFPTLGNIMINRWIDYESNANISLHGFADASEKAYSAVVYSRTETTNGEIKIHLIVAKTRIAPVKSKLTIPKLELCGAVLLSNLMKIAKDSLKLQNTRMVAWSDSMIALGWIKKPAEKWKTFIANRVAEIQSAKVHEWKHVTAEDNPADCASRGLTPEELKNHPLWWHGPKWLKENQEQWPNHDIQDHNEEEKRIKNHIAQLEKHTEIVERFSSWFRIVNVVAYCFRMKSVKDRKEKYLTVAELKKAKLALYKICQREGFRQEVSDLVQGRAISKRSNLRALTPWLDDNGIMRVGGRLQKAIISFDNKHPVILPNDHHLTKLIVRQMHLDTLHGGPRLMMGMLQKQYWIIHGKQLTTKEYQNCVTCRRFRAKTKNQIMGELPKERVSLERAFLHTGVDYAGPIEVKTSKLRSARSHKGYIALFVCLGTGAVHLELVSDQTTDAFMAGFNRFMARRGLCSTIHSDNASTFVKAAKTLHKEEEKWLNGKNQELAALLAPKGIQWKFIPVQSPNFGGLWERNVRSMKDHLKRTLKNARLTFEEYNTVLCQIEATMNSRPIGPLTTNEENLNALTPGHFLIGDALLAPPQPAVLEHNWVKRWNHLQILHQHFWNRWSKEYLNQLQQRRKWHTEEPNIKINDMVLIKEDNLPPRNWLMGRINKVFEGPDKKIRVASIRTSKGIIERNIRKICPLVETAESKDDHQATINTSKVRKESDPVGQLKTQGIGSSNTSKDPIVEQLGNQEPRRNPIRGARLVKPSVCFILAVIYLVITMAGGAPPEKEPIEIRKFQNQPGIFFEHLGRISLIKTEWHMTVYYGLKPYMKEYKAINDYTEDLRKLCENMQIHQGNEHYRDISKLLREKMENIRTLNRLIMGDLPAKYKRKRSAPLNIIGWAQHELFGIMDEAQAEHIETQITTLEGNEQHMLKLIKNQTTIVEASMNLMKTTQDEITQNYGKINKILRNIQTETDGSKKQEQTLSLALFIFILSNRYEETQRTLVDILTDVHHGKINSYLYTPQQFMEQLIIIKSNLPAGCKLPDNGGSDLKSFYKLMTAKARVTEKYILVDIMIPLVSVTEYQLFHIIPIPVEHNKQEMMMIPETEFLVIALKRETFYQMNTNELNTCIKTATGRICQIRHTIYSSQSDKSQCERDFLNGKVNPKCKFKLIPKIDIWIPLHNKHSWIYRVHQKITINILCNNNPSTLNLEKSGIMNIQPGCEVDVGSTTIISEPDKHSEGTYDIHPPLNLSETVMMAHNKLEYLNFTWNHNDQFEEINKNLKILKSNERLQMIHHTTHYGLITIMTIMAIVIFIWWNYTNRNQKITTQPHQVEQTSRSRVEQKSLQDQLRQFENDP